MISNEIKKYVRAQIDDLAELIGGECGNDEKKLRAFIEEEIATVVRFVAAQAKTLDRLSRTVDALLASQGKASSTQVTTAPKASGRRRA